MSARFLVGDVFDRMAELPDASVDLVLTSPPFLALRSYLPADHPAKAKEIGSEPTPAAFLDTLLHLTAEWRRLLTPHGSICVELGDTYSDNMPGWPLAKSLCGIPHLYHLSLAYGRNLLTGEPSPAGQWRVRNVVAWCRPNPPVGALGDKFRPGTSYMTVACVSRQRYFDLDAVGKPPKSIDPRQIDYEEGGAVGAFHDHSNDGIGRQQGPKPASGGVSHPHGAPPLDWWEIPTQPYAGSHYATWPMALCERPIKAMCPTRVCATCGEPSRRIVSSGPDDEENADYLAARAAARHSEHLGMGSTGRQHVEPRRVRPTGEWTDCGHDNWRTGVVLDPFAGSGTTLAVASGHGRDCIGIDIDARNADLARERVGMFLEVDYPEAVA